MKILSCKSILFILAMLLTVSACKKSDDEQAENPDASFELGTLSATINGQNYSAAGTGVIVDFASASIPVKDLLISGLIEIGSPTSASLWVTIVIPNSQEIEEGAYSYDQSCDGLQDICVTFGFSSLEETDPSGGTNGEDGIGTVSISSVDFKKGGHIKGTFSGQIVGTSGEFIPVTGGEFNVNIVE